MKRTLISIAAGCLLAAFAFAQPTGRGYRPIDPGRAGRGVPRSARAAGRDTPAASPNLLVYALTNDPVSGAADFRAVDLASGGFVPIGPDLPPDLGHALLPLPGSSSLLSLAYSGNLYSIDPRTGVATLVGATGLGDCTTPDSPCPPNSANTIGQLDTKYYAIDFSQNLYSLDPATGATKLIGPTGIPKVPFVPLSIDPSSGKLNLYEENLFTFHGKLYANFDAGLVDLSDGSETAVIPAALYQIDPQTGQATMIAPTDVGLLTIVNLNDTTYAFDAPNGRFVILDPATGQTQVVSDLDPSAGEICGATPARPDSPAQP